METHAQPQIEETKRRVVAQVKEYDVRLREFVEEHPVASIAGAAAIGYMLGRLLRR